MASANRGGHCPLAESVKSFMTNSGLADGRVLPLGNRTTPKEPGSVAGTESTPADGNHIEISLFARCPLYGVDASRIRTAGTYFAMDPFN